MLYFLSAYYTTKENFLYLLHLEGVYKIWLISIRNFFIRKNKKKLLEKLESFIPTVFTKVIGLR